MPRTTAVAAASVACLLGAALVIHHASARRADASQARACPAPPSAAIFRAQRGSAAPTAPPLARSGRIFASHAGARRVSIIDLATGEVTSIAAGIADAHEVGVSPDGRWAVAADFGDHTGNYDFDGRRLAIYDLHAGRLARVIDLHPHLGPHDVVFLPNAPSRALVTTQTTRNVIEVDVATGTVLGAIPTDARGSHTMAVSSDGSRAFTANQPEGTISVLDVRSRTLVAKHGVRSTSLEGIAVTADGRELWAGSTSDSTVRVIDAGTGAVLATLRGFVAPERMSMSADGRRILITDFRCDMIRVVDVATRRELGPIAGLEDAGVAKFLPDNRLAVIAMSPQGAVAIADLDAMRIIARWELGRRVDAAAWGPAAAR